MLFGGTNLDHRQTPTRLIRYIAKTTAIAAKGNPSAFQSHALFVHTSRYPERCSPKMPRTHPCLAPPVPADYPGLCPSMDGKLMTQQ